MEEEKIRFAWWYYFWLMVVLTATGPLMGMEDLGAWLEWALGIVGLVGLWGYLRRRPVGPRMFWRAYFGYTIAIILYGASGFLEVKSELLGWFFGIWVLLMALVFPCLLALWRYAFRSPDIWRRDREAA